MKKKTNCLAVIIIAAFFIGFSYIIFNAREEDVKPPTEIRGVFISYIEYMKYFQEKDTNTIMQEIKNMISNTKKLHFNCIYLQVRPFSDSIYQSSIFPFSHTVTGIQGQDIDLDILKYFIEIAHQNDVQVHAWVNPYRISNDTDTSLLSVDNPAYQWLSTNHVKIIENKGIYYNPGSAEVKKLIVQGVEEIVKNYDVDGIMLDDYFYPDDTIDLENYEEVKNTISPSDFRLSQTNELISELYKTIKSINSNVLFGVSPDGNIDNNYNSHYADVKKWLLEDGYIDYIMPQIYYGFLHETKPFIQTVNEWNDLIHNHVKLIVALSIYKSGRMDNYAGFTQSAQNEWLLHDNIIQNQIQVSRNLDFYSGYSIFRYDFFVENSLNSNLQTEIKNYQDLFS